MNRRASALGPAEVFLLRQWGRSIREAFSEWDHVGLYHVGSSLGDERPWRDVDVRIMVRDEAFDRWIAGPWHLQALDVAFTVWGQRATGLPIDFQIQRQTDANLQYGDQPRNALIARKPTAGYRGNAVNPDDIGRTETP